MIQLVLAGLVLAIAFTFLRHANELFVLRIDDGKVRVVRGRIPKRLLDGIADIAEKSRVSGVRVRVISEGGSPRLVPDELSPELAQRIRNVVGQFTVAEIRNAPQPRRS